MAPQDMAEVVPLFGEREVSVPAVEVVWHRSESADEGLRRRVLEHLFMAQEGQSEPEAA